MRECITHHHACDCREERMRVLEVIAKTARLAANKYWNFDESMKSEIYCLESALADLDALGEGE